VARFEYKWIGKQYIICIFSLSFCDMHLTSYVMYILSISFLNYLNNCKQIDLNTFSSIFENLAFQRYIYSIMRSK